MKKTIILPVVLLAFLLGYSEPLSKKKPQQKHNPDPRPAIFAKNVISTADDEFGATFSPDGKTCYFTMKSPSTIVSNVMAICVSHFRTGAWSEPEIVSFSGKYRDFNPSISPDGKKLFFISNRPVDENKKRDFDIWVSDRFGDKWSEPKNIGSPVNTPGWELGCSVTADGTLYFSTTGATGNADLYNSRLVDGKYEKPTSLGDAVNSPYSETDPFIAADGSYLLFASQGRPDALSDAGVSIHYPRGDIYISFHKDGKWTTAKNLGQAVNSSAEESNPWVSRDGKTLYFTSERNLVSIPMAQKLNYASLEELLHGLTNGLGNIYEVPVSAFMKDF